MASRSRALVSRAFGEDRIAWARWLLGVALLGVGMSLWRRHDVVETVTWPATRSVDPTITILAFDRVVSDPEPRFVDAQGLRDHLQALEVAGFTPIRPRDLRDFYHGAGLLPPKPVLLMFDQGHLETFEAADPVLRERRWPATVAIDTSRLAARDTSFVYWDRLRRMVHSGIWDVASSGRFGRQSIPVDATGELGLFPLHRRWLAEKRRKETDEEFGQRVYRDYESSRVLIESQIPGCEVVSFVSPYGDRLSRGDDLALAEIHQRQLSRVYRLGFVDALFGYNDLGSDPHRLRRLRVSPDLSPTRLTTLLQTTWPPALTRGAPAPRRGVRAWLKGVGDVRHSGSDGLLLRGTPRADVWLPGGRWAHNWVLDADIQLLRGQFWLVQKAATPVEEWRWGGHERALHLQHRDRERVTRTLAGFSALVRPGRWHHLRVVKRGRGVWLELDGHALAKRPLYLPGRWQGDIGWVAWAPDEGEAVLQLARPEVNRYPFAIHRISNSPTATEVQSLARQAPAISGIAVLEGLVRGERLEPIPVDEDLVSLLARRYGWELVPSVRLAAPAAPGLGRLPPWVHEIVARARLRDARLLHLDLSELKAAQREPLRVALRSLRALLMVSGTFLLVTDSSLPRAGGCLVSDAFEADSDYGGELMGAAPSGIGP